MKADSTPLEMNSRPPLPVYGSMPPVSIAITSRRDERHPVLAPALTGREEQILRLVASGMTNRQIGERLGLRPQTVKNHVHRVFEKLDVHSRLELIGSLRAPTAPVPVPG